MGTENLHLSKDDLAKPIKPFKPYLYRDMSLKAKTKNRHVVSGE